HLVGQREAPRKGAVGALKLTFAADGEGVIFHTDVNVLFLYVRKISLDHQLILGFEDIDRRRPACELRLTRTGAGDAILEQPINLLLQSVQTTEGFPTRHAHV